MNIWNVSTLAGLAMLGWVVVGSNLVTSPGIAQVAAGRVAFLRTELKITDAQAADWDRFAATLRDRAQGLDAMVEQKRKDRATPPNLLDRMEERVKIADQRAAAIREELAAFRPLYASMSDEQKRTANQLLGERFHGIRH